MEDVDSRSRRGGGQGGTLRDGTYVTGKLFAQAFDEGINLPGFALGDQFDVAVVEIADGAGEGEIGGKLDGGHAKTHALNMAGKENDASLGHGIQIETGRELYSGMGQN